MKENSLRKITWYVGFSLGAFLIVATGAWGTFALYFDGPEHDTLRALLASCFAVASLVALVGYCTTRFRWMATRSYFSLFIVLLVWWSMIEPSNDRQWQPEVAVLPFKPSMEI